MKRKEEISENEEAKKAKLEQEEYTATVGEITEITEMPTMSKGKWKNKTRALIFGSRGLDYRTRHFMQDWLRIMPHAKTDVKLEKKNDRVSNFLKLGEIFDDFSPKIFGRNYG